MAYFATCLLLYNPSMANIWQDLKKPIICLAPMDGVTDTVFRQLLQKIGKPDLMFTEFTHVKAIFSHDQTASIRRLQYQKKEKPLIAQIWGTTPELFESSAHLLVKLGFNGIDINMGCPDKAVTKKGAGAALIDNPQLAKEIILATQKGTNNNIPVSVKTRLGYHSTQTRDWLGFLLEFNLEALTIHLRTKKELSKAPPHWDELKKVIKLRKKLKSKTLILGNGDIKSLEDAQKKAEQYQLDGIMIGRGVFHDPYIFNPRQSIKNKTTSQKINLLLKHLSLFEKNSQNQKAFHTLKKFIKIYIKGFDQALVLRTKLMKSKSPNEIKNILKDFKP